MASGKIPFDIANPKKTGCLLKEGRIFKINKAREFILYPGFLVYYEDANSWRLDITRGNTLEVSCASCITSAT